MATHRPTSFDEVIEQKDVIIIEVHTGTYFGEDDIIRIKDDYNRI